MRAGNFYSQNIGRSVVSTRNTILEELTNLNIRAEKCLDIGCADGAFTSQIAKKVGAHEVYGVDVFMKALKIAFSRGVKAFSVDLNKEPLPFQDNFFDLITAVEVIEHLTDTDNLLQETYRCLRRNGYFVITTPNLTSWINRILLLLGYTPIMYEVSFKYRVGKPFNNKKSFNASGHLRLYTLKALVDHLEIYGFKVISRKGAPFAFAYNKGLGRVVDRAFSFMHAYSLLDELILIAIKV